MSQVYIHLSLTFIFKNRNLVDYWKFGLYPVIPTYLWNNRNVLFVFLSGTERHNTYVLCSLYGKEELYLNEASPPISTTASICRVKPVQTTHNIAWYISSAAGLIRWHYDCRPNVFHYPAKSFLEYIVKSTLLIYYIWNTESKSKLSQVCSGKTNLKSAKANT